MTCAHEGAAVCRRVSITPAAVGIKLLMQIIMVNHSVATIPKNRRSGKQANVSMAFLMTLGILGETKKKVIDLNASEMTSICFYDQW